jgi:hypothetical protein
MIGGTFLRMFFRSISGLLLIWMNYSTDSDTGANGVWIDTALVVSWKVEVGTFEWWEYLMAAMPVLLRLDSSV